MEEHDHEADNCYTCSMGEDGYDVRFTRYDTFLIALCYLDLAGDVVLINAKEGVETAQALLRSSRWSLTVHVCDTGEALPIFVVMCYSPMVADSPLCGFRVNNVPWDLALHLVDGYQRSGNLTLRIKMKTSAGADLEVNAPIFPDSFEVEDPSGKFRERLVCNYAERN